MINFRAKFVSYANIIDRNSKNTKVSFVELDPTSKNDTDTVNILSDCWNGGQSFAYDICENVNKYKNAVRNDSQPKFFALTQQNKDYDKLDFFNILGLVEVVKTSDSLMKINYIQTEPDSLHGRKDRNFIGVGSAIINALKNKFADKSFWVLPLERVKGFYKFNHFEDWSDLSKYMMFKR